MGRLLLSPTAETRQAVNDLYQQSCEGLEANQKHQLLALPEQFTDIFIAWDEDCTRTNLVHHDIDSGDAHPITFVLVTYP